MRNAIGYLVSWSAATAILYASYLLIVLTIPYLAFERTTDFLATKQMVYHIDWWRMAFYIHIFSSPVVILSGLFQFSRKLLHDYAAVHRATGKIYVLFVVLISGPSALVMGFYANGTLPTKISFVLLSLLWIFCTLKAWTSVRKRRFDVHGNFMLRSYALTLSAVTLRFYAFLLDVFHADILPVRAYELLAWTSWVPNLLLAELLIRSGYIRWLNRNTRQMPPK